MRIQPRQQLLETWRATALASYDADKAEWLWGGRRTSNSISDAEQLLCIMLPATEIPRFRLDRPNQADEDVLRSLRHLGDAIEVPRLLVRVIVDYLRRYSLPDGTPDFSGGSYFAPVDEDTEATGAQLTLDVVESFALSITLMLSALGFVKVFRPEVEQPDLLAQIEELERLASKRLSAAMVGLLRSFAINVFPDDSVYGEVLTRTINQTRQAGRRATDGLRRSLRDVAAGLRDLNIGIERVADLDRPSRLFECGWSWGITKGAPTVDADADIGSQRDGYALDEPYLYFTVVALDGINELFSERTRRLGLLTDEQQRLSGNLRLRWDLTQQYWATIASYGPGRWPLEDIPWRTVDEKESDYFSLLVTSIAARDLATRRDTLDADLSRLGLVLVELANRGRITRRPGTADGAVALHDPGVAVDLEGTETSGPEAELGRHRLRTSPAQAGHLHRQPDQQHRAARSGARAGGRGVGPRRAAPDPGRRGQPAVGPAEGGVRLGRAQLRRPQLAPDTCGWWRVWSWPRAWPNGIRCAVSGSPIWRRISLAEAEHLLDQERLAGSAESGQAMRSKIDTLSDRLTRSHEIMSDRPGSATALLLSVLRELDHLAVARPDELGDS